MNNLKTFSSVILFGIASLLRQDSIDQIEFKENYPKKLIAKEFTHLPSLDYYNLSHTKINWEEISKGLLFSRVEVYRDSELVDIIASLKIDPQSNLIRVINGYNLKNDVEVNTIEKWQSKTGANAMINSAQYMADPYYMPCALVICDGQKKGPKYNKGSKGMFVAEPSLGFKDKVPLADLLDFDYDKFDYVTTSYTQGVQHWPILLDREGRIKTKKTSWQANRTVVAKTKDNYILFLTTEGGYFTLYNLGRFLKESNERLDKGFNIHTAMNMDGGYEANMIVKTSKLSYVTYGEFETYGPENDATRFGIKIKIPGVIGIFPRN